MADAVDPAIQSLIDAARRDFARTVTARAARLETLAGEGAWAEAQREAHKLRGSAGVYGFHALGLAAAALDEWMGDLADGDGPPPWTGANADSVDAHRHALLRERLGVLMEEAERVSRIAP